MRYVLAAGPTGFPVSADEAKAHLRLDTNDDDPIVDILIAAATQHFDGRVGILGRALIEQSWRIETAGPDKCGRIAIDMPDVSSIASVKYLSSAAEVTWSADEYRLGACGQFAFVEPKPAFSWPSADDQEDAWRVTFVTGFGAAGAVPAPIKAAILLMIGDLYANRETVVVGTGAAQIPMSATVSALIDPYRMRTL